MQPAQPSSDLGRRISVADCERSQADWFLSLASLPGGDVLRDGGLTWTWVASGSNVMLLFPRELPPDGIARGVAWAQRHRARSIGAWLSLDVDASPLADAGFEHGWSPLWMTAPLSSVGPATDPRIALEDDTPEYDANDGLSLALTRERPQRSWHAAARVDGRFAGRAWSHVTGDLAGVYNMGVWPRFQRRGLGTGLLRAVCAAAAGAGARDAVLNATPQGELLYSTVGFRRIGDGITWWLHLRP